MKRMIEKLSSAVLICAIFAIAAGAQQSVDYRPPTKPDAVAETARLLDQADGTTADKLVELALGGNGDLAALRKEADAADAMIKQAGLRPNPGVTVGGAEEIGGMDRRTMVEGSLPLELFGRRGARIRVALRESEIRRAAVAEKERLLAAEVREKFGSALATVMKLKFTAEMLDAATDNWMLVAATVREGRRAPLEENLEVVELNRLRAAFEMEKGKAEIALLELRNLAGIDPAEPLKLRGDFDNLLDDPGAADDVTRAALRDRPDLAEARLVESLAEAKIEQAKVDSRPDAELMAGYERMQSGFPFRGYDAAGVLRPIENTMKFFTFGVRIMLPVRNRNQGMIEAATAERDAATRRREFGEVTIRNEVATAFVRYRSAARAMEIYRVGVRDQASANLSVVRQTYELGSRTLFDYIAEQRKFIDIESNYIDARLETYLARVAIMKAANAGALTNK